MKEQFIGKIFWITLGGLLASFVVGYFVLNTPFSAVLTISVGLITLVIALHKLEYGLLIAFAELFSYSHGHLFSMDIGGFSFSSRMAIFVAVMIACTVYYIQKRSVKLDDRRLWPYYFLFASVTLGVFIGATQNNLRDVINDGNAYLFALYIFPMLSVVWNSELKRKLLQVLAASASFVFLLTSFFLYFFAHLGEIAQRDLYVYIRDIRLAEVTRVVGDINRIFLQSQFFLLVVIFILIAGCFYFWKRNENFIAVSFIASVSVIIASMSRSFWMSFVIGLGALFAALIKVRKPTVKTLIQKTGLGALMVVAAIAYLWILLAVPIPNATNVFDFSNALQARADGDVAITSRWNLLPAMTEEINKSPIVGSGFGKVVAFKTDDPRVREIYPDGKWRTYAFEWGWHDAWLKMGIFGPLALLWLGIAAGAGLIRGFKKDNAWLAMGLFAGLVALFVSHVFSPYLNHPIGLGYLIFLIPFMSRGDDPVEGSLVHVKDIIKQKQIAQQPRAVTTSVKSEL